MMPEDKSTTRILAGLDSSAADRPVIETALGLAALLDASVDALHVNDDAVSTAVNVASWADVPLRRVYGPVVKTLLAELAEPNVILGVFGARRLPIGKRPAGSTVLGVLTAAAKPVVVVPPEAFGERPRPFRRFLIPLNGTEVSASEASVVLDALAGPSSETIILHVFGAGTPAPTIDHGDSDLDQWGSEFLARHLPGRQARFAWRAGHPASAVIDVCRDEGVDLVVVSWAQVLDGHADVIQTLLSRCQVPVLVAPRGVGEGHSELQPVTASS
jgi:nucleotide-binding universal stress UspA family protein